VSRRPASERAPCSHSTEVVYVEGFAIPKSGGLAVMHAWVTNPHNSCVAHDPTWRAGREYFGIPFRLDYVVRMCEKTGILAFRTFGIGLAAPFAAMTESKR
jgi:hypothetical protein